MIIESQKDQPVKNQRFLKLITINKEAMQKKLYNQESIVVAVYRSLSSLEQQLIIRALSLNTFTWLDIIYKDSLLTLSKQNNNNNPKGLKFVY
jgi:hypothetical protein